MPFIVSEGGIKIWRSYLPGNKFNFIFPSSDMIIIVKIVNVSET